MPRKPDTQISAYFKGDELSIFKRLLHYLLPLKFSNEKNVLKPSNLYYKRIADITGYSIKNIQNLFTPSAVPKISQYNLQKFCKSFAEIQNEFAQGRQDNEYYFNLCITWVDPICTRKAWPNPLVEEREASKSPNKIRDLKSDDNSALNDLTEFENQSLHLYYSTKSKGGKLYWSHMKLEFTSSIHSPGELTAKYKVHDYSRQKNPEYIFKLRRRLPKDNLVLTLTAERRTESEIHCILEKTAEYDDCLCGFMYHDDWAHEWRLSPCLLGFTPQEGVIESGPLKPNECLQLQKLWNQMFKIGKKAIFEQYKLPKKPVRMKR